MFEVSHGLESIAGKSCERTAEADYYEQSPARIYERALGRPDNKEAYYATADDVDEEGTVREERTQFECGEATQEVTQVSAHDGGHRDGKKVFQQRVLSYKSTFGFCRSYQPGSRSAISGG